MRDEGRNAGATREWAVEIPAGQVGLQGDLALPAEPAGLVIFAHGSGSSRRSPRNRKVAAALHERGLATLLFDLLSEDEAERRGNVFDIELLSGRLVAATRWAEEESATAGLAKGYFGASTGAAAALCAAAQLGDGIGAVVSRGGRPDLAGDFLPRVVAPTLLIVGGADRTVLALNEAAALRLSCPRHIAVVPGATHLFEEPGALERVVELAGDWFAQHLPARSRSGAAA
ncbi:MAG: dienelactone hydrolase family protein [Syntrophothermus sp.]